MNTQASDQPVRSSIICEQEGDVIDLQRIHKKGTGTLISISSNLNKIELLQRLQSAEPAIETLHVYVHNTCQTELKNEASKIAKLKKIQAVRQREVESHCNGQVNSSLNGNVTVQSAGMNVQMAIEGRHGPYAKRS